MDLHREADRLDTILHSQQTILVAALRTVQDQLDDLRAENATLRSQLQDLRKAFDDHDRVGDYCPHTGK